MKRSILWTLVAGLSAFALSAHAFPGMKSGSAPVGAQTQAAPADHEAMPVDPRPKGDNSLLKTDNDKLNYIIGYRMLNQLKAMDIEPNPTVIGKALRDATDDKAPAVTQSEARAAMTNLVALREKQAAETLKKGEAFLAANKAKGSVTVTTSGLQYKIVKAGTGPCAKEGEIAKVNYRATFIDGKEFDSSQKPGAVNEFPVGGANIEGWNEALRLMNKGAKYQVFIPAALAQGPPSLPKGSAVIFEIELLDIKPAPPAPAGGAMGGMMGGMHGGATMPGHSSMGKATMPGHPPMGQPATKGGAISPEATPGAGCPMK